MKLKRKNSGSLEGSKMSEVMANAVYCEHEWWDYKPDYAPFRWKRVCRLCGAEKRLMPSPRFLEKNNWTQVIEENPKD